MPSTIAKREREVRALMENPVMLTPEVIDMSTIANRVLDWSSAGFDLELTARVLAVINPGRPQGADYIRRITEKAFYEDDLRSYVGTGGWYVTVYETDVVDADGRQVWRPHVSIMAYSVAIHLNIPVR